MEFSTKTKPVSQLPVVQAKPNHYHTCRDSTHKLFCFWRSEVQAMVCDVCEWDTAFNGQPGELWMYPVELREPLKEALERREEKRGETQR